MTHKVLAPREGTSYEWANDHIVVKAVVNTADSRVRVVEDALKPGFRLARHHHRRMTEIFYVLDGEIEFEFDDQAVVAVAGTTVSIPPYAWHAVACQRGGRLLTVFSPGGFEDYLAEPATLTPEQANDERLMIALAENHDTLTRA
jgi:quercetin dioxygenase-like cupin family protein